MLSNFRIGDRVVSNAIEDDFLVGTVVYTGLEKARVAWPDGTNSTERYQDLVLVRESGSRHPKFLGLFEGPQLHDEDIPKEYQQLLVDQKLYNSEIQIHDNITLRAFWDAKQRFEEQQIAKSLLTHKPSLSEVKTPFGHRKIGSERKDWEPGDIVSVSRPGKNAGKLATAHILRVTPYEADLIWVDPLTKQEIETRESISNLIFVRHDAAWRANKEKTQRLEAEAIGLDTTDFYGFNDIGYPTQLIPDPLMYELRFQEKRVRDYTWNKTQQHKIGDNELSEYNLKELQYGGVVTTFNPFHGFERFADYLWR